MGKTIVVKQIGSPIRRPAEQRQTLIGLGLNKMHRTRAVSYTHLRAPRDLSTSRMPSSA